MLRRQFDFDRIGHERRFERALRGHERFAVPRKRQNRRLAGGHGPDRPLRDGVDKRVDPLAGQGRYRKFGARRRG